MISEVYIVTKGRYSDYTVHGVFLDKALAEEYAEQISDDYDHAHVTEWKPMTSVDIKLATGFKRYHVCMDVDGNTDDVRQEPAEYNLYEWPDIDVISSENYTLTGKYNFMIDTDKGKEGAIKIANEKRIQMIAENKWPKSGEKYVESEGL